MIYPQVSLKHQCNQLLQKSYLCKNWRLETEISTHCSKNSNSLCSTIPNTTWHFVCTHSIWKSCRKNEAVTTPGNGLQKNSLFQETYGQHIMHDMNDSTKTVWECSSIGMRKLYRLAKTISPQSRHLKKPGIYCKGNEHITTHHCNGYHSMRAKVSQIPVTIKVIFWKFTFYILQQKVILHYEKEIRAMNMQIHEPSCAEKLSMHLARTNSNRH